jgi:flavin reductase (DIM6/NTAB) family NADH-FMN oxidoreductase RutF
MNDALQLLENGDRELWLVTARSGRRAGGLIATFVNAASIAPELPRVVVGLARSHLTWELVEASGKFALHLIAEDRIDWVWRFGLHSGHEIDKFAGLPWHAGKTGSPLLEGAFGWLDCRVESRMDTGDRTIYLAEVVAALSPGPVKPLTAKRMLELATPDQLQELKRQRAEDDAKDTEAIRSWRKACNHP